MLKPLTSNALARIRRKEHSARGLSLMPSASLRASHHENGMVFLNVSTGIVFYTNVTGAQIWDLLTSGKEPNQISEQISRDQGVSQARVFHDVCSFFNELVHQGFLAPTPRTCEQ